MGNKFLFIMPNIREQQRRIYTRTDLCHTSGYTKKLVTQKLVNDEHGEYVSGNHDIPLANN